MVVNNFLPSVVDTEVLGGLKVADTVFVGGFDPFGKYAVWYGISPSVDVCMDVNSSKG